MTNPANEYWPLITLEQLLRAKGQKEESLNPGDVERYEQAIETASEACRTFTDRKFGQKVYTASKQYEYEGNAYLDIDDCQKVEEVVFIFGELRTPITTFYYRALPQDGPPYTYLTIPHWAGIYSPEMGFTKNLDVIVKDHGWPGLIPLVEIKGEWGWGQEIPPDVRQAVILTALDYTDAPEPFISENIQGYSYTTAIRTGPGQNDLLPTAIPGRAQDLLLPYTRFQI